MTGFVDRLQSLFRWRPPRGTRVVLGIGLAFAIVCGVMGWLTIAIDRVERVSRKAAAQAEAERLTLWRMESVLGPLVLGEAIRPADRFLQLSPTTATKDNDPGSDPYGRFIRHRFELAAEEPELPMQQPASEPANDREEFTLPPSLSFEQFTQLLPADVSPEDVLVANGVQEDSETWRLNNGIQVDVPDANNTIEQSIVNQSAEQNFDNNLREFQLRKRSTNNTYAITGNYGQAWNNDPLSLTANNRIGMLHPLRVEDDLMLVRRAVVDGTDVVQGTVLDEAALSERLLEEASNLLPEAELVPVTQTDSEHPLQLVTLPYRLQPGEVVTSVQPSRTPMRMSLAIAWGGLLLTSLALATALWMAIRLGERRGTFVSAVTHELRTPLTTFQLYTELLDSGAVTDDDQRSVYLETLRVEAERLGHLVENVLSYSQLERGTGSLTRESLDLSDVVDRIERSLSELATRRGMTLNIIGTPDDSSPIAWGERHAIERILYNLVDNAGKYGASSERQQIDIETGSDASTAWISVRDHGPGIPASEAKQLFRPFLKSDARAAQTAPGIGLGLALCQRLAKHLGGRLDLVADITDGACFRLTLSRAIEQ